MKMRSFLFQFGKWNKQPKEIKRVISYVLNNYELKYAELSEGEVFGEMGLISHHPCSATVSAVGDVQVRYMSNDEFVQAMANNFTSVENILSTLFKRMRHMNLRVMELEKKLAEAYEDKDEVAKLGVVTCKPGHVTLSGLTDQAQHALGGVESLMIEKFPFRIGRWAAKKIKTSWFFGSDGNDLDIHDIPPYGISRHHCHLERQKDAIYMVDNSRLGVWVNGERIENKEDGEKKVLLEAGVYTLSLGSMDSVFSFELVVW